MATEFSALRQSVDALGQQLRGFDTRLNDLNNTLRTVSAPPPAPPPSATTTAPVPSASTGAPPGFSATATFESAYRDYNSAKYDLALEEFRTFLQYAANTENGPKAYYYIGQIYYRQEHWDDAAKAFDAVLERYPENSWSPDAMLYKAQSLMKDERDSEAIAEFKAFVAKYPGDPNRARADMYLKSLTTPPAKATPRNTKKSGR